jgi:hypothetical protein
MIKLYFEAEMTQKEEEEMIRKIAERIHDYGMDIPGTIILETIKPLSFIGSQMGHVFISPFLPILGVENGLIGEKLIRVFENRGNVDKILKHLERLSKEGRKDKKTEK